MFDCNITMGVIITEARSLPSLTWNSKIDSSMSNEIPCVLIFCDILGRNGGRGHPFLAISSAEMYKRELHVTNPWKTLASHAQRLFGLATHKIA